MCKSQVLSMWKSNKDIKKTTSVSVYIAILMLEHDPQIPANKYCVVALK